MNDLTKCTKTLFKFYNGEDINDKIKITGEITKFL